MTDLRAVVSDELAGWVADAARRFDLTRSEIVELALEHYLRHVDGARVVRDRRSGVPPAAVDWEQAKQTVTSAKCTYELCPFDHDCPAEVCAL
jgi:hypothetical protein